jgi:ligand-binding sensor domain-containing protein
MSGTKLAGAVAVAMALGAAGRAAAVDLQNVLADYTISAWNQKDGLPANAIFSLAQDSDGSLWVGTGSGHDARGFDVVHVIGGNGHHRLVRMRELKWSR